MKSICWLIVFLVLLVLEIISLGLTTIWFALGALVAFIATLAGAGYVIQFIVFIAVSFVTLVLTRPLAVKYFNTNIFTTYKKGFAFLYQDETLYIYYHKKSNN